MACSKEQRGNREGITFLITTDGELFFGQYTGDEATCPPHRTLQEAARIGFERIRIGGAVTKYDEVKWSSGTCQLGLNLKSLVNQHFSEDERPGKRGLKGPFPKADSEIHNIIKERWGAAVSQPPCQSKLSPAAMQEIEIAVASRKDDVVQEILTKFEGAEQDKVASVLVELGRSYDEDHTNGTVGNTCAAQKKVDLLERALNMQEEMYGKHHAMLESTLIELGRAYKDTGNCSRTTEVFDRVLALQEREYGKDHRETANTMMNLGNAYGRLGDYRKTKELLERALAIDEREYGKDHRRTAITLASLGNAYGSLGDHRKKQELLERALAIDEREYGKDHRTTAATLTSLGAAYWALGDYRKQQEFLERALAIKEREYGKDHRETANTLTNLGTAHRSLGDHRKEQEFLERALAIKEREYGKDHRNAAPTLLNLGRS